MSHDSMMSSVIRRAKLLYNEAKFILTITMYVNYVLVAYGICKLEAFTISAARFFYIPKIFHLAIYNGC
jgi:hypothetical protein